MRYLLDEFKMKIIMRGSNVVTYSERSTSEEKRLIHCHLLKKIKTHRTHDSIALTGTELKKITFSCKNSDNWNDFCSQFHLILIRWIFHKTYILLSLQSFCCFCCWIIFMLHEPFSKRSPWTDGLTLEKMNLIRICFNIKHFRIK